MKNLRSSVFFNIFKKLEKDLYDTPLKTGGIFLSTAISSNILAALMFQIKINPVGWIIRGILLLAAAATFFSGDIVYWPTLAKNSIFLRLISKK